MDGCLPDSIAPTSRTVAVRKRNHSPISATARRLLVRKLDAAAPMEEDTVSRELATFRRIVKEQHPELKLEELPEEKWTVVSR